MLNPRYRPRKHPRCICKVKPALGPTRQGGWEIKCACQWTRVQDFDFEAIMTWELMREAAMVRPVSIPKNQWAFPAPPLDEAKVVQIKGFSRQQEIINS